MAPHRKSVLPTIADDLAAAERLLAREAAPVERASPIVRREPTRKAQPDEDTSGRKLWSAGHAIAVCVSALAISLLLNAPGVHKKAYNLGDGWQRDVALAFTGPLKRVSGALQLDRPRSAVQAAIGRAGTDDVQTAIVLDDGPTKPVARTGPAGRVRSAPAVEARPAKPPVSTPRLVSPSSPLRIWIAGDSLAVTPGYAILRAAGSSPLITPVGGVDGRIATGLTRPDVFNWFDHLRTQVRTLRPSVVVLGFGGNDDKAYMTGLPPGVTITAFGDAAWQREYRRRVGGVLDMLVAAGAHVVWLGLPTVSDSGLNARYETVNAAVLAEIAERPGSASYVDTASLLQAPGGGYAEYLTTPDGTTVKVRAGDGIHLDPAGGDIVAGAVLSILNERFDLARRRP